MWLIVNYGAGAIYWVALSWLLALMFVAKVGFESIWLGEIDMTFVVTDVCIRCKYTDCVEVCPVDCFYEGENMLVISPDECIDCGVCEPECPIDAILPDTDSAADKWVEFNQKYSEEWPNITEAKPAMPEAEEMKDVKNKLEDHFSAEPGEGD